MTSHIRTPSSLHFVSHRCFSRLPSHKQPLAILLERIVPRFATDDWKKTLTPEKRSLFVEAVGFLGTANFAKALPALKQLAKVENNPFISTTLAICWSLVGDKKKALEATAAALKLSTDVPEAHLTRGFCLAEMDQDSTALRYFDAALQLDRNDSLVYKLKGLSLTKLKRHDDAIVFLDKCQELGGNDESVLISKAISLSALGHHDKALQSIEAAVKEEPNSGHARFVKGLLFAAAKKQTEALNTFDEALKLANFQRDLIGTIQFNKGLVFLQMKKYQQAYDCCYLATKLRPNFPHYHEAAGLAKLQMGLYDESIEHFDRALELDSGLEQSHAYKGNALLMLNRNSQAVECFNRSLELKPDDIGILQSKGFALVQLGHFQEAVDVYDKLFRLCGEDRIWQFNLMKARCLTEIDRHQEALTCINKFMLKSESVESFPLLFKMLILHKMKRHQECSDCADQLMTLEPKNAYAHYFKGVALGALQRPEESRVFLHQAQDLIQAQEKGKPEIASMMENFQPFIDKYTKLESLETPTLSSSKL